jgi:hypothetical protein
MSQATGTPPPLQQQSQVDWPSKVKGEEETFARMVTAYKGKCNKLKGHVYDVVPGKNGFDTFTKTTTEIGQYIACTVLNAGEFALIMRPDNLGFLTIPEPAVPQDQNDLIELEKMEGSKYVL